jgi:hypothetical protein
MINTKIAGWNRHPHLVGHGALDVVNADMIPKKEKLERRLLVSAGF